ncbi:TniQ family protein [Streptomyces sp. NBC_01217]|uniref:TniQ family protein n=1 Tax=Streptomyces sp. NBC_01217 TaxID=2903779 RepID=UPI002E12880B|nr:TniQ family protein [Streptomyces sp. NBC_01217]
MDLRPLPRSLLPLPDESLPGLLLRLAHRLDVSPGRLAVSTGLVQGGPLKTTRSTTSHLLMLTPDHLEPFSRALRLPDHHVDQLTLRPLVGRLPAVADALTRPGNPAQLRPRGYFPPWILSASTRFCPLCLAGDGSEIQQRHGGAWKLHWRLGVVFACVEHQLFLQEDCPSCLRPAQSGNPRASLSLVPSATVGGLHPTQCRNTTGEHTSALCGSRLDCLDAAAAGPPSSRVLQLQRTILNLLHDSHDAAQAFTSFSDLAVVAAVVTASWPATATVTPETQLADALDDYVSALRRTDEEDAAPRITGLWAAPPRTAAATAGLLDIATRLLALPPAALEQALALMLATTPGPRTSGWGNTWRLLRRHGSAQLQNQIRRAQPARPGPRAGRAIVAFKDRYQPEHIPQWLPDAWFAQLFTAPSRRSLCGAYGFRRFAAVQLVQISNGMTLEEAAAFLGIPDRWHRRDGTSRKLSRYAGHYRRQSRKNLETAFTALARHISGLPDRIDYRARRLQYYDWALDAADWAEIAVGLPRRNRNRHPLYSDDLLRHSASEFIWTRITGSESCLFPGGNAPLQDPADESRAVRIRAFLSAPPRHLPFFSAFRQRLISYSTALTASPVASP